MYTQIVLTALLLQVVCARPQAPNASAPAPAHSSPSSNSSSSGNVTILSSEFVDMGDGSFRWAFETSDGFKAEQTGQTAPPGMEGRSDAEGGSGGGEIIKGSYSYKDPEGKLISVTYIADENAYGRPFAYPGKKKQYDVISWVGLEKQNKICPTQEPPNPHANLTSQAQAKPSSSSASASTGNQAGGPITSQVVTGAPPSGSSSPSG